MPLCRRSPTMPLLTLGQCDGGLVDEHLRAALDDFVSQLATIEDVEAVWVGGSLATGDHVPGVSDLDLVALTRVTLDGDALEQIAAIHTELDAGAAAGMNLGCQYADRDSLADATIERPTWTHGELITRAVSLVTRVELAVHGSALTGPPPHDVLPAETGHMVVAASQSELAGYWSWAARHPQMFWRLPVMVDLGLTAMARARHGISRGELLTKSAAIEQAHAPDWLKEQLRARRRGEQLASPRWRAAYIAWRDVQRTTATTSVGSASD